MGLIVLREPWNVTLALAGALMAFGVWLHLTEQAGEQSATDPHRGNQLIREDA